MRDFPTPKKQLEYLRKGAEKIVQEEEFLKKLERSRKTGEPLTVKVGFDPSAPDIHLGHTVVLRKMKHFQDMGHRVVFLIGDFTGLIGDPSGRSKTRPVLTREEVQQNAETYKKQAFKILDPEKTTVVFNSSWLGGLGSEGFIRLAAQFTVARMLERDDFLMRYKAGQPIGIHEFLYPLAQAYDSVVLRCDVELGGTDQTFNLLVARDIMREHGLEPQVVMTLPLLEGTDGVEKMSKTLDNFIGIEEPPKEIFGKVMSISDDLMWKYYTLLTDVSAQTIDDMRARCAAGKLNPRDAKAGLAKMLIVYYHGEAAAREAEEEFQRVFSKREVPEEIETRSVPPFKETVLLSKFLAEAGLARSNSEARRLMHQGAVELNGARVDDVGFLLGPDSPREMLLKVGKRRFLKVLVEEKKKAPKKPPSSPS
ncbi:MAG: tyrosine--tRNA ligase [Acidobacteriota bacterium]|nr:MAG: tyrosine--tRNA ligase [Acidobacteriota bacterium]